ncbi:MAG: DUF3343 domain-containing protein [Oscillospiraceae bacterium]|nr:DUF3343 domain-containing protein [Oscillospiraceae bacterium]
MYVVVGSATAAERVKKAAERVVGFPAYVVHTPAAIHHSGCSYSVRLDDRALNEVKTILYDNGISFKGIYIEETEKGERVYHAVS